MSAFHATLSTAQLQALSLLLQTGSISSTGLRLGLTQSAISHVLAGLRRHFGDELLVRRGHGMQLTPFADGLRDPVRRVLLQIEDVSALREKFDPAGLTRACVIAARDLTASLLAPSLLRRFADQAPNATLRIIPWESPRIADQLAAGQCDLAIGVDPPRTDQGLRIQKFYEDQYVAVSARARAPNALTLQHPVERPALVISRTDDLDSPVDEALAGLGLKRRIVMRSAYFLAALSIVAETDTLMVTPRRLAEKHAGHFDLALLNLPLALPGFSIFGVGHERFARSPLYNWLRGLCLDAVADSIPRCA